MTMPEVVKLGKYLEAHKLPPVPRQKTAWEIRTITESTNPMDTGFLRGKVVWAGLQYAFRPAVMTTFNAECLADLARFLTEVNDARRP